MTFKLINAQNDIIIYSKDSSFIEYKGKIINNKKNGLWTQFNKEGQIIQECIYYENSTFSCIDFNLRVNYSNLNSDSTKCIAAKFSGLVDSIGLRILHGNYIVFYCNGQTMTEFTYKNNSIDGNFISFNKNGDTTLLCNYKEGKLDGIYIKFNKNSQISIIGQYKEGNKIGIWKEYDDNGKILSIGEYQPIYYTIKYEDYINFNLIVLDINNQIIKPNEYNLQINETLDWIKTSKEVQLPYKMYLKKGKWIYYTPKPHEQFY